MHSRAKFHQNLSNSCRDIAFHFSQNGSRPPSGILKFLKLEELICIVVPNLIKIGRKAA